MRTPRHRPGPLRPAGRTVVVGFASTQHPTAGVDVPDTTARTLHRERDLTDVRPAGVRHRRHPLRRQRIEPAPRPTETAPAPYTDLPIAAPQLDPRRTS